MLLWLLAALALGGLIYLAWRPRTTKHVNELSSGRVRIRATINTPQQALHTPFFDNPCVAYKASIRQRIHAGTYNYLKYRIHQETRREQQITLEDTTGTVQVDIQDARLKLATNTYELRRSQGLTGHLADALTARGIDYEKRLTTNHLEIQESKLVHGQNVTITGNFDGEVLHATHISDDNPQPHKRFSLHIYGSE